MKSTKRELVLSYHLLLNKLRDFYDLDLLPKIHTLKECVSLSFDTELDIFEISCKLGRIKNSCENSSFIDDFNKIHNDIKHKNSHSIFSSLLPKSHFEQMTDVMFSPDYNLLIETITLILTIVKECDANHLTLTKVKELLQTVETLKQLCQSLETKFSEQLRQ